MSSLRDIATVAAFEFRRVFKPKDFVITLVLFCCGALFFAWLRSLESEAVKVPITVLGDVFELPDAEHLPFNFLPVPPGTMDEAEVRRRVAEGEFGSALFLRSLEDVELLVPEETPDWYPELVAHVDEARMAERVKRSGLADDEIAGIFSKSPLAVSSATPVDYAAQEKLAFLAAICLSGMMIGLFVGSVNLFTGITGEKQNHITESVLSAIPVQVWIDGKCVGLALVAFVGLASLAICWMIANQVYGLFYEPMKLPLEIVDVSLFLGFVTIGVLGFLMWFAFFAAIAATIDDPNTSSRSTFMFLPVLATGLAFMGLEEPEADMYRLRSVFPITSPGAMVVRLVMGKVAAWEFLLCVLLLLVATWAFRLAAGKIFGMAMLMRGKELSWRELWRAFVGQRV